VPSIERMDPAGFEEVDVRRPSRSDPRERPLANCNDRSLRLGGAFVAAMFPNLPIRASSQTTDGSTLVTGKAAPALLRHLRAQEHLASIFQRCQFDVPSTARLVKDLQHRPLGDLTANHPGPFPGGRTRLRLGAMAGSLQDGYTLVLDGFDLRDAESGLVAEMFERVYACPVNINGYLSSRTYSSFGAHWDEQDVVIVQLVGRKHWSVYEPSALSPLQAVQPEGASGDPIWQGTLEPGDTLFIPRGWPHLVKGLDEVSFHHTITMPRLHVLDVLERATSGVDPSFAALGDAMPLIPADDSRPILPAAAVVRLASLRDKATARLQFDQIASRSTRPLDLRGPVMVGESVRCPCPGGLFLVDQRRGDHVVGLGGAFLAVAPDALDALAGCCDGRGHVVTDANLEVVRALADLGLVERWDHGLPPWWHLIAAMDMDVGHGDG